MKNIIGRILIALWLIIGVTITFFLFKYNDYKVVNIDDNLFVIISDEYENFNKHQLFIVKDEDINYAVGDYVLYYDTYNKQVPTKVSKIKSTEIKDSYLLEEEKYVDKKYIINKVNNAYTLPFVGQILYVLESAIGYLGFVVLPAICLFLYLFCSLVLELKQGK